MKLLVCISKAPDTTAKIAFTDGNSKFDENGVQYIQKMISSSKPLLFNRKDKRGQGAC